MKRNVGPSLFLLFLSTLGTYAPSPSPGPLTMASFTYTPTQGALWSVISPFTFFYFLILFYF